MDENFVKTWSQKDFHEIAASLQYLKLLKNFLKPNTLQTIASLISFLGRAS